MIVNFTRKKLAEDILREIGDTEIMFPILISHEKNAHEQVKDLINSLVEMVNDSNKTIDYIVLPSLNIAAVLTVIELVRKGVRPKIVSIIPDRKLGNDIVNEIISALNGKGENYG